jgi:hypothetical protein
MFFDGDRFFFGLFASGLESQSACASDKGLCMRWGEISHDFFEVHQEEVSASRLPYSSKSNKTDHNQSVAFNAFGAM